MAVIKFKEGVTLVPSSGGARIIAALWQVAQMVQRDITVTSGSDGAHSGPDDPHHRGDAYDVRTHDQPDAQALLIAIENTLADTDSGRFYAFLEDAATPNEHIHCQVRKGTVYP